jgi:hypothetical protein
MEGCKDGVRFVVDGGRIFAVVVDRENRYYTQDTSDDDRLSSKTTTMLPAAVWQFESGASC